jgi:hypothetical protein
MNTILIILILLLLFGGGSGKTLSLASVRLVTFGDSSEFAFLRFVPGWRGVALSDKT